MDNDTEALKIASAAVTAVDVAYRLADGPGQFAMSASRDHAWTGYALARQKLLMDGIVTTDAELTELDALARDLDAAADTSAIVAGAEKLAALLGRIALA